MVNPVPAAALLALLLAAPAFAAAPPDCTDVMPPETAASEPGRPLVPEDLVRLRDIGPVDPMQQHAGLFSVSPDGRYAAFQVRRGDPVANGYCLAMAVAELRPDGRAVMVDRGGDFIRYRFDFRGKANFPSGVADTITPRWSPDGRCIVYRRRDKGAVQLWRARTDGSSSEAITNSIDDVIDFRITADGDAVVYATKPGLRAALAEIDKEGLSGFHYDDRFSPTSSNRPFATAPISRVIWFRKMGGANARAATPEEAALLDKRSRQEGDWTEFAGPMGAVARVRVPADSLYASRGQLLVERDGRAISCGAAECRDASYPWWVGDRVRFLRREGWRNSETAIYEWKPGNARPRRLYSTEDLLLGCVPDRGALICLREGALQPRRLERLDPATGVRDILFDPNPEFAKLTLGRVERLRSRNSFGLESFADLVLPVGYQPGKRYPLVVVQYVSRGFLRGGTGDDYPIQAFANRGFAVLSVDKPDPVGIRAAPDYVEGDRINLKDFADRRSVLEAVEDPVRVAIARGIADPARIGITGLSDGSSTVQFALLHSRLFSAYASSSCCWDTSMPIRVGPGAAKQFHAMGYPRMTDDSDTARAFWRQIAITPNAERIRSPILVQIADDEYWSALQSFTALRELDRPIDMFVFPGEHHVKWQPAHRLATYRRAIDWFDFWLNGVKAPGRDEEIARWEAMRRAAGFATKPGVAPAAP
ncbi:Atxe2 family lasso peptide isopeptidase [Sphingomonas psychrotolerans]|uniref:Atxe2 family lasso peptide isopeptidase n=1 Tax=Sphingomonas psychrotolerans TaxID=1327635 RepID=A0ABU3N7S8_9SPHN|nr:Atxe2 family lasso peptide isopeptidase [Sphingomonas psychrotolerans]MDT8760537.1 Atxe2 family lasso peptide isopeptidase [Sphingomonas psychrotolerans]